MTELTVDFCALDAARYAVTHWHYSRVLPAGNKFMLGVWERGVFIGCVIFSQGATGPRLAGKWGLPPTQVCELTRVALTEHTAPVSQIVARALRELHRTNPGIRLVISFADPMRGHHGGIYQAGGWIYTGRGEPTPEYVIHGRQMHARSVHAKGWLQREAWLREHVDPAARRISVPGKHRYLMPLDRGMRRTIARYAQPYPPAVEVSTGDARQTRREGEVRSLGTARRTTPATNGETPS